MKKYFSKKIKSSAIIIALVVGILITIITTSVLLIVQQRLQITAQSRQGKQAYHAALSGIEDALMLIRQAKATNQLASILNYSNLGVELSAEQGDRRKVSYDLSIASDAISSFPDDFDLLDPIALGAKLAKLNDDSAVSDFGSAIDKFNKINVDNSFEIDISKVDVSKISIYFSKPHYLNSVGKPTYLNNYLTALNLQLIKTGATGEKQLVYEHTSDSADKNLEILSAKIGICKAGGGTCKIKIRPQAVSSASNPIYDGSNSSLREKAGKYIYFAVVAKDRFGAIISGSEDKPGVIRIDAVGYAGQAVRRLEAKVDLTSGSYLGLFDFGIYCGEKCEGRGVNEL